MGETAGKRWKRSLVSAAIALLMLCIALAFYVVSFTSSEPPEIPVVIVPAKSMDNGVARIGNNWLRHDETGLWEMYIEGRPYERGLVHGKLASELMYSQEKAFVARIKELVHGDWHLRFLKYFVLWFHRNLTNHVQQEQQEEIAGVAQSASSEFNYFGEPYQRILNYHAAHDIGHALQNLALVGCSSFAAWGKASADSTLIVGRNFDFYAGDDFAKNKIVMFCKPSTGYAFVSITWAGMTGVLSGMNTAGLTVTINAAKSPVPTSATTPVSLLSREILQYASNIHEAVEIASRRKTFVAESFLISSASDRRAVVIEKSTDEMDVYEATGEVLLCTNHYQSKTLGKQARNVKHMASSASTYRMRRLEQLIESSRPVTVTSAVSILRDRNGIDGKFIGLGNEKAVNQLICHHSIIFKPALQKIWISTSPWQEGAFVCYDLRKIFGDPASASHAPSETALTIAADLFLNSGQFADYKSYLQLNEEIRKGQSTDVQSLVVLNPGFYKSWLTAGDVCYGQGDYAGASRYYAEGLKCEIANVAEEEHMQERLKECRERLIE